MDPHVTGAPTVGTVVYLDHAATTPLRPEVREATAPFGTDVFANPSGAHAEARRARRALDDARDTVAARLGAPPDGVVFTSGGTEADNLAVLGVARRTGGTVVCTAVEHHAVLGPVERTGGRVVPVDATGRVDQDALAEALTPDVRLVSVMAVNNEVGTIQPLAEVAALVRERAPEAVLHTDAVQGAVWLETPGALADADLVTVSAHKLGGPKGAGALVIRSGVELEPLMWGGGQEWGLRPGTQNVAGAVGLAAALEVTAADREERTTRIARLSARLLDGLIDSVDGLTPTVPAHLRVPGICHVTVEGVDAEELVFGLERAGVMASAGASCASGALEPSHVLSAMGLDPARARGALRLSLGWSTTDADVDRALDVLPDVVRRLRRRVAP